MIRNLQPRLTFFAFCFAVASFLAPAAVRAQDLVKDLENALKIDPQQLVEPAEQRKQVDKILPRLKTLSELRGAYFLKEWLPYVKYDKETKKYLDEEMYNRRKSIGDLLQKAVFEAAKDDSAERKIAVAIMIAEMAERDQPEDRSKTGKFASAFVDLLIGKNGLVNNEDARVKQAGWHALGKITPKPDDGLKKKLREALAAPELGVRRVAAYALSDLIKNAHYFDLRNDELETVTIAVTSAGFGLRQVEPAEDEFVRAYCLQAIFQAGRIFMDYGKATENAFIDLEKDEALKEDKQVVNAKFRDILAAINAANPRIAAAVKNDPANTVELRLTALETVSQIVAARGKLMDKLFELDPKADRVDRGDIFKRYKAIDPISYFLEVDKDASKEGTVRWNWEVVSTLLEQDNDLRLRRGAMLLLESVAEDVESALAEKKLGKATTPAVRQRLARTIAQGLVDPDYMVRWSAARTMRFVAPENIDAETVRDLGRLLIDRERGPDGQVIVRVERDPNLSATAVVTLEAIASNEHAWTAVEFLKSAIIDRKTDVEIRVAALRTLVQIGRQADKQTDASKQDVARSAVRSAFPQVASVLADVEEDVRMRRAASEALGQLGQPATRAIAEDVLAVLKQALRDDDSQIRQHASEAILSIRVPAN